MKKRLIIIMLIFIGFIGIGDQISFAATKEFPYKLYIDGKRVVFASQSQPLVVDGTAMVPFRPVFQQLGMTVKWKVETKQVLGENKQVKLVMTLGSKKAVVNGQPMNMPAAPIIMNGTTYIPLRFIAECDGGELQLYGEEANYTAWFLSKRQNDLFGAVLKQDLPTIEKLLNEGADPTVGVGPLGPAIFSFVPYVGEDIESITLFLKYGMDINAKESFTNETLLHGAVIYERVNMLKYLLEHGANPRLDSAIGTPLDIVNMNKHSTPGSRQADIIALLNSYLNTAAN